MEFAMWSCFGGFLSSQKLKKSKKLKTATTIMHHSDEYKPSSSSVAKVLRNSKNKDVVRPSNTTSVRSITELLTFRYLVSPSKSNDHHHLAAPLHVTSSSSKSSFLSSSVNLISNNEDLLTQILLFLPAKSVIRFQCVSKQWLSLISSSHFRRLHSQQNPTSFSTAETGLFLFRRIYQNSELNSITFREEEWNSMGIITSRFINFLNVDGQILGLHCCNGLVWVDFHWNYEIRRYYVYNPATNQYRFIPRPKTTGKGEDVKAVNIVYDPLKSDQYKLVCILLKSTEEGEAEAEYIFSVYTSETGVWKDVYILTDETYHDYYFERGVVCNGNLYWTNSSRDVLCFDFEIECVRSVNMTSASEESSDSQERILFYFGNSGRNLHLIDLDFPEGSCLNVFELELDIGWGEYPSEWLLKYRIDLDILTARYPLMLDLKFADFERRLAFGILSFLVEEKENKATLMISLSGKIIFYEINGMKFEEIVDIQPADLQFLRLNMSRYNWKDAYKHFVTLACV